MWEPDSDTFLVELSRAGVKPWERDLLTYDEYLTFKVAFRNEPQRGLF